MEWIKLFIEILYVIATFLLILVVLLQAGRGGGMGTALGGGASQSVFGGGGSADFLARFTQALATIFMVCAVVLATRFWDSSDLDLDDPNAQQEDVLADADEDVDYEQLGGPAQARGQYGAQPLKPPSTEPLLDPADLQAPGGGEPTDDAPGDDAPGDDAPDAGEPSADDEPTADEPGETPSP
jgi:preprotein translocase subunit SecG